MQKILIALTAATLSLGSAYAAQLPHQIADASAINWSSAGAGDSVTITNNANTQVLLIAVDPAGLSPSGIVLSGCGPTTSVAPGSSVICFSSNNSAIKFSASNNQGANGTYTVLPPQ